MIEDVSARVLVFAVSAFCAAVGFAYGHKRGSSLLRGRGVKVSDSPESEVIESQCGPMVVLHGSLRDIDGLLEHGDSSSVANQTVDSINDYLTLAASRARESGGHFERYAGASFVVFWQGGPEHTGADERALCCALNLRKDFFAFNEARKVDGHRPLLFGMGIHAGRGLVGKLGPAGRFTHGIVGDVVLCAAALDQHSAVAGSDLLISESVWENVAGNFLGDRAGEARLTALSGLVSYFGVRGYQDQNGKPQLVETPYVTQSTPEITEKRWLVNNGSQIVGPFTSVEIAARLFAQEMDFDSECWVEGTGSSSQISAAGIFGQSEEEDDAHYWVFDGKTVHGPLSKGLLMTAVSREAIASDSYVCEGSTVEGWKPLKAWRETQSVDPSVSSPLMTPVLVPPPFVSPERK